MISAMNLLSFKRYLRADEDLCNDNGDPIAGTEHRQRVQSPAKPVGPALSNEPVVECY
jgi:hypothetical protein